MIEHDVQHRDAFASLAAMRDRGGARLIVTSPPYPDARTPEQYGGAEFDTSLAGYGRLGEAVFEALMPGGVCALNIDGPIRVWRPEIGESERSLIAFEVAIDWAKRIGFRYLEHDAKICDGRPGSFGPRARQGWEPMHVFARPGGEVMFDASGYTLQAKRHGEKFGNRGRKRGGMGNYSEFVQGERRQLTTAIEAHAMPSTIDQTHPAPFSRVIADAYVLRYSAPGDIVGDPFVGSGTVAESCHRHGRVFVGGDIGHRDDGKRWADVTRDKLRQLQLFGTLGA